MAELEHIDGMIDFAVSRIADGPKGTRSMIRDLAIGWPDASGLELVFVIVSAVNAVERVMPEDDPAREGTAEAMRLAALLGTDLYALEKRGRCRPTGAELLDYWEQHDPYFLEL